MATYTATYKHEGKYIDYTPGAAVSAGDVVVLNDIIGVATQDIAADDLGALKIQEVFTFPKATGTGEAIAQGKEVYWDAANEVITETAGANVKAGVCVKAAGDAAATIDVLLCPGIQ